MEERVVLVDKQDNEIGTMPEHKLEYVCIGYSEETPNFNAEKVCDYCSYIKTICNAHLLQHRL